MEIQHLFQTIKETPQTEEGTFSGNLPTWLCGYYHKMGNGIFDFPSGFTMKHLFDGLAITYQFKITPKKVEFRSKYLNSDAYIKAISTGNPQVSEFATPRQVDPNKSFFSRLVSTLAPTDITDNCCGNIIVHEGKLFSLTETLYMHRIDPETLQSCEKINMRSFGGAITSNHFCQDEKGGSYNVGTSLFGPLNRNVFQLPSMSSGDNPFENLKPVATVPTASKTSFSYLHSFGMTENYFVVVEQPCFVKILSLLSSQVQGKTLKDCMQWYPNEKLKFYLVERSSGKSFETKYLAPAAFFLHVINAFEEDGHVVIDITCFEDAEMLDAHFISNLRANEMKQSINATLKRYVLPLVDAKEHLTDENLIKLQNTTATAKKKSDKAIFVTPEILIPQSGLEFCKINPKYSSKKNRFIYASGVAFNSYFRGSLCKIDLETKEFKLWKVKDGQFTTEPEFVSNPNATAEDDGVIVSVVVNEKNVKGFSLVFLDGQTFTEIARAEFQSEMNLGNHGSFMFHTI